MVDDKVNRRRVVVNQNERMMEFCRWQLLVLTGLSLIRDLISVEDLNWDPLCEKVRILPHCHLSWHWLLLEGRRRHDPRPPFLLEEATDRPRSPLALPFLRPASQSAK